MSSYRRDSKTAAKRRAEARKRTREIGRYIFTYSIIAVLLLSVVSSVFILQTPQTTTPPPGSTDPFGTPTSVLHQLVEQGDQAYAAGNWQGAIDAYKPFLALQASEAFSNAEINYRMGKAYLNIPNPDYGAALDHLQRALNINPNASWAPEVQQLILANQDKVPTPGPITGTVTLTGTAVSPGAPITGTRAVTATVTAPATPIP